MIWRLASLTAPARRYTTDLMTLARLRQQLTTTHSVGEQSDMGALPPSAPVAPAADKLAFIYDDDD